MFEKSKHQINNSYILKNVSFKPLAIGLLPRSVFPTLSPNSSKQWNIVLWISSSRLCSIHFWKRTFSSAFPVQTFAMILLLFGFIWTFCAMKKNYNNEPIVQGDHNLYSIVFVTDVCKTENNYILNALVFSIINCIFEAFFRRLSSDLKLTQIPHKNSKLLLLFYCAPHIRHAFQCIFGNTIKRKIPPFSI